MKKIYFFVVCLACLILVLSLGSALREGTKVKYGFVLYVRDVTINPSEIPPGSNAELMITLENIADTFLRDVYVRLNLPDEFAPSVNGVLEKRVRTLDANRAKIIYFDIMALPDAKTGVYTGLLNLEYVNEIGETYTENNTISLVVGGAPQLYLELESSEIYGGKYVGDVVISIINSGPADVKFLTVELFPSFNYEIISSNRQYVGNVDSDDAESVEFRLRLETKESEVNLPLLLSYRDASNKEYNEQLDFKLYVHSAKDVGKGQSNMILIIVLIVLIIVGYFSYKKYINKKSK